jgi:hypothetical protein
MVVEPAAMSGWLLPVPGPPPGIVGAWSSEVIMADHETLALARPRPAVEACWMCGIRLPVTQMVADGGDACGSVRWYCRDVRGCTERWTTRPRLAEFGRGGSEAVLPARAVAGG